MIVCDLCVHYRQGAICGLELKIPKTMSCREFSPGIQKFCANPKDFVDSRQVIEMATFFGMKGTELKKVKLMAIRAENSRL
jgi:hypothetical protein